MKSRQPKPPLPSGSTKVEHGASMNKNEAIAKLEGCVDAVKARGATSLYMFGSSGTMGRTDTNDPEPPCHSFDHLVGERELT